jgi:monothiol glutaredoxin
VNVDTRRLESLVRGAIPDAEVEAIDVGGGDHFELTVISDHFENVSLVARHRSIYAALGDAMQGAIHAVTIRALTPVELAGERESVVEIYMKGTASMPQCGFSNTAAEILRRLGVEFKTYDVLSDPGLREGIKQFSNWPTVPQLYVNGEFVGGADIMRSMYESGELEKIVRKDAA